MDERFASRLDDSRVRHDLRVLADFTRVHCDAHHADRVRRPADTDGASSAVYGAGRPVLCAECEAHLAYAEKRRAHCPKDPKPFCAHCDTHCYRPEEAEWQREMMRFSGPRWWRHWRVLDGLRHSRDGRRALRALAARKAPEAESGVSE